MNYNVQLNNGQSISLQGAEFDASLFTSALNDPKTIFVNIAGAVINKHLISCILPEEK